MKHKHNQPIRAPQLFSGRQLHDRAEYSYRHLGMVCNLVYSLNRYDGGGIQNEYRDAAVNLAHPHSSAHSPPDRALLEIDQGRSYSEVAVQFCNEVGSISAGRA